MNKSNKEAWTGGKNISPEAMEKRKQINKKILLYGFLPIAGLMLIGTLIVKAIAVDPNSAPPEPITYNDPMNLGVDSVMAMMGKELSHEQIKTWGTPKTLPGTDGANWMAYLDKANVSFVTDKKTDVVIYSGFDEESAKMYMLQRASLRKEEIDKQFSSWDGSHIELSKAIKKSMNDPNSYEHEETVFWDQGDHLVVRTVYRGKNAFGGIVKASVKVKTDISTGAIIEVIEQS